MGQDDPRLPLLLDHVDQTEAAKSTSEVRSGAPVRWIVAGFAAVGLLMWGLFQWPEPDGQSVGDRATEIDGEAGTTTEPGPTEDDEETGDSEVETTEAEPEDDGESDTDSDDADSAGIEEVEDAVEVGLVLGEETGLGLVVGSWNSSSPVSVLDLDTGLLHELEDASGLPVAVIGTSLVLNQQSELVAVDLADPTAEPKVIFEPPGGWVEFVEAQDDLLWVIDDPESERLLFRAYNLEGEVVDQIDMSSVNIGFSFGWGGTTKLIYNGAGGIYRRDGGQFERLSTGLLRAVGDRIALVHECDDRMQCRAIWHDRDSWEPLDFPAPENSPDSFSVIAGNDRWLVETNWRTEQVRLTEVRTGKLFHEWEADFQGGLNDPAPISADGRWLVDKQLKQILDLDRNEAYDVDDNAKLGSGSKVLFVDLTGTGFG